MIKGVSICTENDTVIEIRKDFKSNVITIGIKDENNLFDFTNNDIYLKSIIGKFLNVLHELKYEGGESGGRKN